MNSPRGNDDAAQPDGRSSTSTPTLAAFKAWARENRGVARAVCVAKAFAQLERERVDAYIRPVFEDFEFHVAARFKRSAVPAGERIGNPRLLYLCDDEDKLSRYYAACDAEHRRHGFTGPGGHCPALIAETLLAQTENLLLKSGAALFGTDDLAVYGDNRTKLLELLLGACLARGT